MKKEYMENALTQIDDAYMTEALEYKKSNKKIITISNIGRIAAAVVLLIGIGTMSTLAYGKIFKETKADEEFMYVGRDDFREQWAEDEEKYGEATVYEPEYEEPVIKQGTENTLWVEKRTQKVKKQEGVNSTDKITTYVYDSYEKAAKDKKFDQWFADLPGEIDTLTVKEQKWDNIFYTYTLRGLYKYGSGLYDFEQMTFGDRITVADDAFYTDFVKEPENVRKYTNKNGVLFTLTDGIAGYDKEGFSVAGETKVTSIIVCYGKYLGEIQFKDMSEKEIHNVLDCFVLEEE